MLLTEKVRITWNGKNKKYYELKGYVFTKIGDEFEVKIEDLAKGSHIKVEVKCDCKDCENTYLSLIEYRSYLRYLKEDEKYYCQKCSYKLFGKEKTIKTRIKNGKSFTQWCYDNLSKEEATEVLSRWDYELNVNKNGNVIKPSEISHSSIGLKKRGYWFKCLKHKNHKSELKNITSFTSVGSLSRLDCKQCNSFAQWCNDNNRQDILDRWDYDLNGCNPYEISYANSKKYYFKCNNNIHKSELKQISSFTGGHEGTISCRQCNSFEQWCINNNKKSVLELWDYELNKKTPLEVDYGTTVKYYFKCLREIHKSELKSINCFTNGQAGSIRCNQCNSFAQWGIDNLGKDFLEKYWDYDKNTLNPFDISYACNTKVWIKCKEKDYHGSYKITCSSFSCQGSRCSLCCNQHGKVHPKDSLGQYITDNYGEEFLNTVWSDKNEKSAFEYTPMSNQNAWFKCHIDKHEAYEREISSSVKYDFRCPECVREREESILQEKVKLYFKELGYDLKHEYKCNIIPINPKTNHQLPYDNEIIQLKLVVEVHGKQHYQISSWDKIESKKTNIPEEHLFFKRRVYDRYKKIYAKLQGYEYLEIPYWTDNVAFEYKKLIDDKIKEVLHKNNKNIAE